jgi:hypothetical protein
VEAAVIAYKFLRADRTAPFTGFRWPLGEWVEARVDPCRSGIHACRTGDLPYWIACALFEVELDGDIVEEQSKLVASRARLTRRIDAFDDALRDAYTRMAADRAHELARGAGLAEWDAVVEPSVPEGPALLGFVAARIAEEIDGPAAYHAERARQAAWLVERLALDGRPL